jgi:hypothetical protein
VVAQLGAELADVDVDGAGVGGERVAPDPFQDLVAGEDQAPVADQVAEQLELTGGELHRAALEDDLVAGRVDGEAAQVERGLGTGFGFGVGAAQDRLDPGDQLAGRERLGHVVVGAELEAEDPVGLLLPGRDHDDRHPAPPLAQRPGHLEPVHARQHQVEQDQPGPLGVDRGQPGGPVGPPHDPEAVALQVQPDQVGDGRLVLDQQHGPLGRVLGRQPVPFRRRADASIAEAGSGARRGQVRGR